MRNFATLPAPSTYPPPLPASVETSAAVPAPPQAAEDAEALRLAARVAEAVALRDSDGDDVRDADRDCDTLGLPMPTRRDDETEVVRLPERDTEADNDADTLLEAVRVELALRVAE